MKSMSNDVTEFDFKNQNNIETNHIELNHNFSINFNYHKIVLRLDLNIIQK